jgi:hypothetical protein
MPPTPESPELEKRRQEILLALSHVWSEFITYRPGEARIEYVGAIDPTGWVTVIQGSYHDLSHDGSDARLTAHMTDALRLLMLERGIRPFTIWFEEVEGGWRGTFGNPLGMTRSSTVNGEGPTRSWATAEALVRLLCPDF